MKRNAGAVLPTTNPKKKKKVNMWSQAMVRLWHDKLAMVGLIGILLLVLMSICAPLIAPYSPTEMDLKAINAGPTSVHWFGTDGLGRDILSRFLPPASARSRPWCWA